MRFTLPNIFERNLALMLLLFVVGPLSGIAQAPTTTETVDSLIKVLINLESEEDKADVLLEISYANERQDYQLGLDYAEKSLEMAEAANYQQGMMKAHKAISHYYTVYLLNYFEGINSLAKALEIAEELHDSYALLEIYQKFGFLKYSMGDTESSISYYEKAIRIAQQKKEFDELAALYSYIGDLYYETDQIDLATDYYGRVNSLYEADKLDTTEVSLHLSLAMHFRLQQDYKKSIQFYMDGLANPKVIASPRFQAYTYSQLAMVFMLEGRYSDAIDATEDGLKIANELNLTKEKMDNYQAQIAIYDSLGDYRKTYSILIKYTAFKDSLNSFQIQEQNMKYQTNYEKMVSKNEIERLNEEQVNHDLEIENEKLNRNIIIGLLVFVSVIVILMILRLRYINKKEKELRVLSLATSHTTNSIVIFDKEIRVEWVNQGFEKLTGLKLKDVKGKYFLEFYNGPELPKSKEIELDRNFRSGEIFTMELSSFHRQEGSGYWISISVTPLLDDDGDIMSYVSVATDISDIHEAQLALQQSHDSSILLNEIGRQITSTLSVKDIIEKVYENVNKMMDAQNLGIGIYRESENHLFFPEPVERGNKLPSFNYDLENKNRIAVKSFLENKEIVVGDEIERNAVTGTDTSPVQGDQPNSIIYMPLISKWKTMGVISVQTMAKHAYGEKEISIVRTLATYVAIALENAGLYENMEDRVEERTKEVTLQKEELQTNFENTKMLSELGVTISSSLEFEDIFKSLFECVSQLMPTDIFGVLLYKPELNEIQYKYAMEAGERHPEFSVSTDDKDNYSVWCVENDKEVFVNDNLNEYSKYVKEIRVPQGKMPNSLIFYPLHGDGKVMGVITVQSYTLNAYNQYHLAIVKTLGSYTSAALHNANLYDTLEQKVEERTTELAQKNKDIMASINYAKRIQRGILPSSSFMSQLIPNNFVFYKPRDVVSGDFYWVERSSGKVFFAVVDCTGHGVPGALMSIIGKNILDQAVNEKGLTDPSMILAFLRAGLRFAFGADEDEEANEVEDGMDLGICIYEKEQNLLEFAGANINLHIVREGELITLKGDKSGVSASDFTIKHFTCHEHLAQSGDVVYLSSDGYPDQFGGERRKKFSQRRFQELLVSMSDSPFEEHYDILKKQFYDWKGDLNQLDDVCVMGVKF